MSPLTPFDPAGPLPRGTAVLEASAGTGKTHAIAGLAVRYLAEGVTDAAHLVVVTFGRSATAELVSRLHARLTSTLATLEAALDDGLSPDADAIDRQLAATDLPIRVERLRHAALDADRIATMTIHGFCDAMTRELGLLAPSDPLTTLIDDQGTLLDDLTRDLYLRRFGNADAAPPFSLAEAASLAALAIGTPDASIAPEDTTDPAAAARVEFARAARAEFANRKRRADVRTYDDHLTALQDCLRGPQGEVACARLRDRFRVVLVDEFQDTDPVQWDILRRCFHQHCALVLIGDPKQSIYAFRGADVASYQAAAAIADEHRSLGVNYRSDAGVVSALNELFAGLQLGPGIGVPPVAASHTVARLHVPDGAAWGAPVRLRCVTAGAPLSAGDARHRIADDLTAQVALLLAGGTTLTDEADHTRPVRGDDIAVLVRSNARGSELAETLTRSGIAAAFTGADSVYHSRAAASWLALLRALDQPRRANLRAAVLTDFMGGTLGGLATATEQQLSDWSAALTRWSSVLNASGVAALFALILAEHGFGERLVTRPLGERDLTDYRHVAELLNARQADGVTGGALIAWLADQIASPNTEGERTRRLETDEHAVQIMTVHRAKGLQFPVVLLPHMSDLWLSDRDDGRPLLLHDADGRRLVDVGGPFARGRATRLEAERAEAADEALRVLYVAATRAQSQLVLWWARTKKNTAASPLQRVLFRSRDTAAPRPSYPVNTSPGDGNPADLPWIARSGISVEQVDDETPPVTGAPERCQPELALPSWTRHIDQGWRRTSYSGLTAGVHAQAPGHGLLDELTGGGTDEPEPDDDSMSAAAPADHAPVREPVDRPAVAPSRFGTATPPPGDEAPEAAPAPGAGGLDEAIGPASATAPPARLLNRPSPMATLPSGTTFGTAVHAVFEALDWYAPSSDDAPALRVRLSDACAEVLSFSPLPGVTPDALADAMMPVLFTPLGDLTDGRPLASIPTSDRLAELSFEYPLTGVTGDVSSAARQVTLADVAALLRAWLPADDPLAAYPDHLLEPDLRDQPLRGFITGSIDAVLRVGPPAPTDQPSPSTSPSPPAEKVAGAVEPRFLIIDYKTNRITPSDDLTLGHFTKAAMATEMIRSHYPLQALVYSVALHRFLRARLPDYRPEVHLGGVGYLFVRGMGGPDAPWSGGAPTGVFTWHPNPRLIVALSDLLTDRSQR